MDSDYINDFANFLKFTDEKDVLFREISEELKRYHCNSLLDIGAGNGLLAIPLSKQVNDYTAVEPKEKYVQNLKDSGLKVISKKFPVEIDSLYDAVLFSHVFSYRQPNYDQFIRAAWKYIKPGGILIIVTYRGEKDDWAKLLNEIGSMNNVENYPSITEDMNVLLSSLGSVTTRKIITRVRTENMEDMLSALSFVASNGIPERKEEFFRYKSKLVSFLDNGYRIARGYEFPFQHFIVTTQKA